MSNSKESKEIDIVSSGQVVCHVSTGGATTLPPSAGVPLTAAKTSSGKVTRVNGVLPGTSVIIDLPDNGK